MPIDWKPWVAPVVVIAVGIGLLAHFDVQFSTLHGRIGDLDSRLRGVDEKIDRRGEAIEQRVAETNKRVDTVLEIQRDLAAQVSGVETGLTYVKGRLDQVAQKLEIASAPVDADPKQLWAQAAKLIEADPLGALKRSGIKAIPLWDAGQSIATMTFASDQLPDPQKVFLFSTDPDTQQKIEAFYEHLKSAPPQKK